MWQLNTKECQLDIVTSRTYFEYHAPYYSRLNLKIDPAIAARIVAMRPALEALIVKATNNPEGLEEPNPDDTALMEVVRALSKISAGKFGVQQPEGQDG